MSVLGQEQYKVIGGKQYKLPRFELPQMERWMSWARRQFPSPVEALAPLVMHLSSEELRKLVNDALRERHREKQFFDMDVQELFHSPDGQIRVAMILLQEGQPGMTETEAHALCCQALAEAAPGDMETTLAIAQGVPPAEDGLKKNNSP